METWLIIVISVCIISLMRSTTLFIRNTNPGHNHLPPGPSLIRTIFLLRNITPLNFEPVLKNLKTKYGQSFTISLAFQPSIFISNHSLAHQLLIKKGAVFSDRLKSVPTRNISSASYGPTWRLFRRNLSTEMMHPTRIKSYSWARKSILHLLIDRLQTQQQSKGNQGIIVVDHFKYAMVSLLMLMCFGDKIDETRMNEFAKAQLAMSLAVYSGRFTLLTMFPKLGKILFGKRWKEYKKLCDNREKVLIPIIKSRIESKLRDDDQTVAYVDTLMNLNLPNEKGNYENGGKLSQKEMVSMCSEFISAGSDTTTTALQWIMANLVKYPQIQKKVFNEIVSVVGFPPSLELKSVINEEDVKKMSYLKAVVLEALRRHPPAHFLLPHKSMKEVKVEGYVIPKGTSVNFMVAEMGLDPNVWDDPMVFKPERFLVNYYDGVFDINGSKEIKMMPFGAGRRICPGLDLALLHLEYIVANLIWYFDWVVPHGCSVDLTENTMFTVAMKNPLKTQISLRAEK